MGKKQFIDKKNSRVFRLVSRSVVDGDKEEFDEEGNKLPDRVFAEVTSGREKYEEDGEEVEVDVVGSASEDDEEKYLSRCTILYIKITLRCTAGEAAKYGIFYDDRAYDYTQHLKPIGKAPGAVFMAAPAITVEHNSQGDAIDEFDKQAEAERALSQATYDRIKETDADPAVLETLEALEDDAFIDEDAFEDDFIVKLDKEEIRVLAPMETRKKGGRRDLSEDFEKFLNMSGSDLDDEDLEYYEEEEFSGSDVDIDVTDLDSAIPFSRGGPSRMYQVDEVRKELRDGAQALIDRILYETDEDEAQPSVLIEVDDEATKIVNIQTACQFLSGTHHKLVKPKIIKDGTNGVKPIRISNKTGMPIEEPAQSFRDDSDGSSDEEESAPAVNKGEARPRTETPEEKKARKAAVKEERRIRRSQKKLTAL